MVNEILGANIRKYRLAFNWTQEKLADILCVSHQVISKWENGIASPDIAILCSLTRIFNVSLDAGHSFDSSMLFSFVNSSLMMF